MEKIEEFTGSPEIAAKTTDWDSYYAKPASAARFTRKISERKILKLLRAFLDQETPSIAELGGANSCFVDAIVSGIRPKSYVAIDNNAFGLSLLEKRYPPPNVVQGKLGDALNLPAPKECYDAVFSIGLIEHFDTDGTAACIKAHFDICKKGGIVLIAFPTPTLLYRAIRGFAEITNNWHFHDERPLHFLEVESVSKRSGALVHRSTNWAIGLTQGYLVYRKQ